MNADGDRVAPFENLAQQCAKKLSVSRFPIPSPSGEGVLEDGDLVLMTTAKFWRPTPSMNTLSADKNLSTVGRLLR